MISIEWKYIDATEFCSKITDGTHDSPKRVQNGKKLITSKHIKGRNIDFDNAYNIALADYEKINLRSKVDQWDVIISMIGEYCGFCYVEQSDSIDYAIKNVGLYKTGNRDKAFWLYYYLNSPQGKQSLLALKSGTSQPYISLGALRSLQILVPSNENELSKIVEILSTIDDKIDLLQSQNKTLEQLAQTLFRQWFIEEAQDGWEEGILDDILSVKGGTTPSTKVPEYWDGDIHWTTPRDLSTNDSPFLLDTARKITKEGLVKISSGLLPVGTLLLSSRAPVGYLAFSEVPISINQGYIAIINDKGVSSLFIYLWLKENMDYVVSYANGSTFLEISKSSFKTLEILIPPENIRNEFDLLVNPLFEKIKKNVYQIHTLETLRNTLLPKLISGEIRVKY